MNENNMPMNSQEPISEETCPCCPRHCHLSAPSCGRGEHYANLSPEEREQAAQHGERPEREGEHGHHSHHKPHDADHSDAESHFHEGPHGGPRGPHHGPHGPHGEPGPEPRGPRGPGPRGDHGPEHHGPHGGPGSHPRPEFLEDPDSLGGLMHRCIHTLHHKADRDRGQKSALAMLYAWGEVDQRTLQENMGIQPGSVSELLSKLEAKGYITRARSEKDRRMVTVQLTDAGREAAQNMPSGKQDRFAALTQEEQEQLKGLLKKLLESWQ